MPVVVRLLLGTLVLVAGIYDIRWRRIPNWLVLPALLVGFALNTFLYGVAGLEDSALGFGIAVATYLPLYLLRGMGAGDVKLAAAIGALVGWGSWVVIFILSGLLGGVLAMVVILAKSRVRKTFSNLGYIVWEMIHLRPPHLRSEELDIGSPRALKLPHGAVIALGSLAFLGIRSAKLG